ncbi:MAG TPA: EAL domain-containing protein [Acidimicrobiia bacterium]|nr:EAL domain-containing protein [Acidimicrobiia bacterium]
MSRPLWVATFAVAAFAATLLVGAGGQHTTVIVDDVGTALAALAAAAGCWWAWRHRGVDHGAWALMGAASVAWAAGEVIWGVYELGLGRAVPFPSAADAAYLSGTPLALASVWWFSRRFRVAAVTGVRALVDGLIITASLFLASWVLVLGPAYRMGTGGLWEQGISLAYPAGDIVTLVVVLAVATHARRVSRPLLLIGLSLVAMAVADSTYAYMTSVGSYDTGSLVDAGWVAAYLLIAAAGFERPRHAEKAAVAPASVPLSVGQIVLPYVLAVPACLIGAKALIFDNPRDPVIVFTSAAVLVLVVLRQLTTLLENRHLNRELESTIADLRASEQELRHLAFHDPLTKLANRALLQDRVTQALLRRERSGDGVSVIMVDVDDFKLVNDTLGHQAGDALLVASAERLRACVRREDTVARVGGDEFGILVVGVGRADTDAAKLAGRILEAFRVPFTIAGREIPVTVSIGISDSGDSAADQDALVRNADMALYAAKRQGKSRAEAFVPEMRSVVLERLELKADLKQAVTDGQLVLHYQPIVDLRTGRVTGLEALLRWAHPRRGLLLPSQFVGIAEETGDILDIGLWVVAEASRQARALRSVAGPLAPLVHVNFSARQLVRGHVHDVLETIRASGTDGSQLVFEITEGVILDDRHSNLQHLHDLKRLGSKVALDDFGTGYSSLSYLSRFPIDIVKLDRTFIGDFDNQLTLALTRGIVDLAHSLDLLTIAEGVETEGQLRALRTLGCDQGQGYGVAPPVGVDGLDAVLDPLWRPVAPPAAPAVDRELAPELVVPPEGA